MELAKALNHALGQSFMEIPLTRFCELLLVLATPGLLAPCPDQVAKMSIEKSLFKVIICPSEMT